MTKEADSPRDGTQGAQPEGSESAGNQNGSSQTDAVTVEQFNKLQAQLENLRRSFQSDKDRGVKQVREKVDGLENEVKELLRSAARSGKSAGDVLGELEEAEERESRQAIIEFARAFRSGQVPVVASPGSEAKQGVDVSEVVRDLELDTEDMSVRAFMTKKFDNEKEAYREAAKLQKSLLRQPSEADAPSPEARRRAPAGNQDQLMKEYQEGSKNLYGRALLAFKQKMREKGLDIH